MSHRFRKQARALQRQHDCSYTTALAACIAVTRRPDFRRRLTLKKIHTAIAVAKRKCRGISSSGESYVEIIPWNQDGYYPVPVCPSEEPWKQS